MADLTMRDPARGTDRHDCYTAAERGDIFALLTALCYAQIDGDRGRITLYRRMSYDLPEPADPKGKRVWAMLQKRIRPNGLALSQYGRRTAR